MDKVSIIIGSKSDAEKYWWTSLLGIYLLCQTIFFELWIRISYSFALSYSSPAARKKISELYNSDQYRVEFKLNPGDLLMMDNHRLLHGRTSYDVSEGKRYLKGCYIDHDSTEGKLRYLERKFKLKWKK